MSLLPDPVDASCGLSIYDKCKMHSAQNATELNLEQLCAVLNKLPDPHVEIIYWFILRYHADSQGKGTLYGSKTLPGGKGVIFPSEKLPPELLAICNSYIILASSASGLPRPEGSMPAHIVPS